MKAKKLSEDAFRAERTMIIAGIEKNLSLIFRVELKSLVKSVDDNKIIRERYKKAFKSLKEIRES